MRERGLVLDGLPGQLGGGFPGQLLVHIVAHVVEGGVVFVLQLADEIYHGVLGAAAARQRQLAARNLESDGKIVFRPDSTGSN